MREKVCKVRACVIDGLGRHFTDSWSPTRSLAERVGNGLAILLHNMRE